MGFKLLAKTSGSDPPQQSRLNEPKVLIVGGNGHFGRLLSEDYANTPTVKSAIGNRRSANLFDTPSVERALSGVAVAICAAGPFQELPTTLAESCLRLGIHYVDFADDRHFVRKIHSLVKKWPDPQTAVCTAWSTVSALSGLLTRIAAHASERIDEIYIHMAPGNRVPERSTITSLLHSVGISFTVYRDGNGRLFVDGRPAGLRIPCSDRAAPRISGRCS